MPNFALKPSIHKTVLRSLLINSIIILAFLITPPVAFADDRNVSNGLNAFEKADLRRLIGLDFRTLGNTAIQGVLGYDQEFWMNPASVHVIKPQDVTHFGYANSVEALRGVPGMHVSRGLAYDNFASMRNFSGFSTQKFLGRIGGREVSQLMQGSANYSVDDYPIAVIDRIEVIRGPGASIWGTNAVNGVINLVTKHSGDTQGNSIRTVIQDNGTFMGDYVQGGQISEDSFYRFWIRNQEYAEGKLKSGLSARDDGHLRKGGFRFDKELAPDLNLYIAGGFATRKLEHVLDLSNRLLYHNQSLSTYPEYIPLSMAQELEPFLFSSPFLMDGSINPVQGVNLNVPLYPSGWDSLKNGKIGYGDQEISRFERFGKMTNDSSHLVAKLDGITDLGMEWSLTGFVDHTDIYMGHLGFEWEQTQYDLAWDANLPIGKTQRLSFGASVRRTSLDVHPEVIEPFQFLALVNPLDPSSASDQIPVLDYDQSYTEFNKYNFYLQNSISVTDSLQVSVGAKFEENDFSGFGFQPGIRASWMIDDHNIFWSGYSKTHRQPSLRERYTNLTSYKIWTPVLGAWVNKSFTGDESLDREEMDAFEIGWRSRPSVDLLLELSTYHYDTKNAVRGATSLTSVSAYEAKNAKAWGGEFSFDWHASELWRLSGGYSIARGEVEGLASNDFPESTASLSSQFQYTDGITLIQNLFYSDKTEILSDYNPSTIPSHLRLDLGVVWEPKGGWEIGLFGRDLLEPYHMETMYPGVDVEPARVERTFLLTLYKKF